MPANIVPRPIPRKLPYNRRDNNPPIIKFDESNAVFIFPNSMWVTCRTASETPSPGSTIALDFTSI